VHQNDIDGHAVEPGRELRLTAEIFEAPMNLEEDFLDDVFELGARAHHPKHQAAYLGAVSKEELSESLAIPTLAARDHFVWFEHSIEANPRPRPMPEQNARDRSIHYFVLMPGSGASFKTVALTQHFAFHGFFGPSQRQMSEAALR
jgi:hypothetical protein